MVIVIIATLAAAATVKPVCAILPAIGLIKKATCFHEVGLHLQRRIIGSWFLPNPTASQE